MSSVERSVPYSCPVCNGTGQVSRPPGIPGDQPYWYGSVNQLFVCQACSGSGVIWKDIHYTLLPVPNWGAGNAGELSKLILFDFDGTIVTFAFPEIGEPRWKIINAAKRAKELGYTIGVWSGRSSRMWSKDPQERGKMTAEMVEFLDKIEFPYDYIFGEDCDKVPALFVVDDTAVPATVEAVEDMVKQLEKIAEDEEGEGK